MTGIGGLLTKDDIKQSRLSSPVGPNQTKSVATVQLKGYIAKKRASTMGFFYTVEGNHRR